MGGNINRAADAEITSLTGRLWNSQTLAGNSYLDAATATDNLPSFLRQFGLYDMTAAVAGRQSWDGVRLLRAGLHTNAAGNNSSEVDFDSIQGVRGNRHVTPEFKREVREMAERLGTRPEYLMAVMSFESGGSFAPDKVNPRSGATGLIQFMPDTARGLGTSTAELARMSAVEQLKYVEKYFQGFRGRLNTLAGTYTSVLSGRARPNSSDVLFRRGTAAYTQNRELDFNRDGQITSGEATSPVAARLFGGVRRVQERLKELGFNPGTPDGRFGPNTSDAVADFQRSRNLPATGLMTEATGVALGLGAAVEPPTERPQPAPTSQLERGSRGDKVEALQENLVALGHMTRAEQRTGPGIFGPRTEEALQEFQRANNLTPNGIYNQATRQAMSRIFAHDVRRGARGKVVEGLQERLVELGYLTEQQRRTGPGIFGPQTEAALKKFQREHQIEATGVLGPQTYRTLQTASARSPQNGDSTPSGRPVDAPITSRFGWRRDPFTGARKFHGGIDFGARAGTRVSSTAGGRVVFAGFNNGGFGNLVIVEHGNGYRTYYAHMSQINVREGQTVTDGQKVGEVGSTGRSTAPHLHYEIRRNNERIDPFPFLN